MSAALLHLIVLKVGADLGVSRFLGAWLPDPRTSLRRKSRVACWNPGNGLIRTRKSVLRITVLLSKLRVCALCVRSAIMCLFCFIVFIGWNVTAGRSGLAVACLTAVREILGSNRAVGRCVYRTTTAIYSLGHGLCTPFLQCLGQLSLLATWDGK